MRRRDVVPAARPLNLQLDLAALAAGLPLPLPVVVWPFLIVEAFRLNDTRWVPRTGYPHGWVRAQDQACTMGV